MNNAHWGVLYENEIFRHLSSGKQTKGYIKKIRKDDKFVLILQSPGYQNVDEVSREILDILEKNNGIIKLTDKSNPKDI